MDSRFQPDAEDQFLAALAGLLVVLIGLAGIGYGSAVVFNGFAFLSGHGTERTVYVESVDMLWSETSKDVTEGVGYYIDADGTRHACSVIQDGLKPGAQVQARSPVIPIHPPSVFYDHGEARAIIFLALFFTILGGGLTLGFGSFLLSIGRF
ncbi:hypothetical protein [Nocardia yamanashiensis]|uniref:hypothetical protein n=1 Tax=Nocardia yamanashiensis TaxID=209247 RepID=UPI000835C68B|nr:hypothetical protein [Nocardia yamanashiensis]